VIAVHLLGTAFNVGWIGCGGMPVAIPWGQRWGSMGNGLVWMGIVVVIIRIVSTVLLGNMLG